MLTQRDQVTSTSHSVHARKLKVEANSRGPAPIKEFKRYHTVPERANKGIQKIPYSESKFEAISEKYVSFC